MQNHWSTVELVNRVDAVFQRVERQEPHHLGRNRYLTAYQIVLDLAELYPDEVAIIIESGWPLGGKGIDQYYSLSQRVARQLSQYIRDNENALVEGAFLSILHLDTLSFTSRNRQIPASSNDEYSIFRRRSTDPR